jgi:hypothetical protein
MEITHPFFGLNKTTELSDQVKAYVARIKELPTVELPEYEKAYWMPKFGKVPAGTYSDPTTAQAEKAVEALYHALKGAKITRHRVAVALNFQSADDVDDIRDRLYARGALIWEGAPGISVHSTRPVADVLKVQAAKRALEAAAAKAG